MRFANSPGLETMLDRTDSLMADLGYDPVTSKTAVASR